MSSNDSKLHDYEELYEMPHPVSEKHPRMDMISRAAQFSPFAALTGYEDAVSETARLTGSRIQLTEDEIDAQNDVLRSITPGQTAVKVVYFVPDPLKDGGEYQRVEGIVKKIDSLWQKLILSDGREIPIGDILRVEILRETNI